MIEWDRVAELYDIYVHSDMDISFFIREIRNVSGQVLDMINMVLIKVNKL
ncbi:hypothetical protein [Coleofasciculus chthonoplastes]|jgi:hypothetical protein